MLRKKHRNTMSMRSARSSQRLAPSDWSSDSGDSSSLGLGWFVASGISSGMKDQEEIWWKFTCIDWEIFEEGSKIKNVITRECIAKCQSQLNLWSAGSHGVTWDIGYFYGITISKDLNEWNEKVHDFLFSRTWTQFTNLPQFNVARECDLIVVIW